MRVAAIVLAAGFSKRLGTPKQQVVFEGNVHSVILPAEPYAETAGLQKGVPQ